MERSLHDPNAAKAQAAPRRVAMDQHNDAATKSGGAAPLHLHKIATESQSTLFPTQ